MIARNRAGRIAMKKTAIILLLPALLAQCGFQAKRPPCHDDDFSNCRVTRQSYDRIHPGIPYGSIVDLLGSRNRDDFNPDAVEECKGSDSAWIWSSDTYANYKTQGIGVGFKNGMVFCEFYVDGMPKEAR